MPDPNKTPKPSAATPAGSDPIPLCSRAVTGGRTPKRALTAHPAAQCRPQLGLRVPDLHWGDLVGEGTGAGMSLQKEQEQGCPWEKEQEQGCFWRRNRSRDVPCMEGEWFLLQPSGIRVCPGTPSSPRDRGEFCGNYPHTPPELCTQIQPPTMSHSLGPWGHPTECQNPQEKANE